MALALNKIIVGNTSANTAGSYLQPVTVSSVGAGNSTAMLSAQYIPAGLYIIPSTANVTVEVNYYTGSANSWTSFIAANTTGILFSDGYNMRANATTGTQTLTIWTVNGGNAITGTFNS